jgi:hypothetical protein
MAGSYRIQWANGLSFEVFRRDSLVEIVGSAEQGYAGVEVFLQDTNVSADRHQVEAQSRDGRTIEIELDDEVGTAHRGVMVEWTDSTSGARTLFGEIFVGDPDGAGGFGGQQDTGGDPDPNG